MCFGEPRRLSVDLDFNYVGNPDREAMLAERPSADKRPRAEIIFLVEEAPEGERGNSGPPFSLPLSFFLHEHPLQASFDEAGTANAGAGAASRRGETTVSPGAGP